MAEKITLRFARTFSTEPSQLETNYADEEPYITSLATVRSLEQLVAQLDGLGTN